MLPAATASLSFSLRLQAAQGKHVGAAAVANVKLDPLASSTREIDCLGTVMGIIRTRPVHLQVPSQASQWEVTVGVGLSGFKAAALLALRIPLGPKACLDPPRQYAAMYARSAMLVLYPAAHPAYPPDARPPSSRCRESLQCPPPQRPAEQTQCPPQKQETITRRRA